MEILAAILGAIVGLYSGIWTMRYVWKVTSDGYWEKDAKARVKHMEETKANALLTIMSVKFLAKGGLVVLAILIGNWLYQ